MPFNQMEGDFVTFKVVILIQIDDFFYTWDHS